MASGGRELGFAFYDRQGRDLGWSLFGAAAWQCQVRDRFLNWSSRERAEQLPRLANNTRFLILPWVGVKHLASHVLGQVAHRISADWQQKYGHGLGWLETFVDTERYSGACYRAANWRYVGQTAGRSRQDRHISLGPCQSRLPLRPVQPMNALLDLEVEILTEGREWTRRAWRSARRNRSTTGSVLPAKR